MRKRSILIILAMVATALAARPLDSPPTPLPAGTLVIRGGWLFDGTGETMVRNRGILIQDSLFVRVNAPLTGEQLRGAQVIDLRDDDYMIPGMFDLHAHYA